MIDRGGRAKTGLDVGTVEGDGAGGEGEGEGTPPLLLPIPQTVLRQVEAPWFEYRRTKF